MVRRERCFIWKKQIDLSVEVRSVKQVHIAMICVLGWIIVKYVPGKQVHFISWRVFKCKLKSLGPV